MYLKKLLGYDYKIGFAGNPNVGKTSIFNNLTGMHQHTGNWPGKTVANAYGICKYTDKNFLLVDLPGTYSLMSNSTEEEIARNYICFGNSDLTVVVTDATNLERNLNLVFQVLELTPNVVVCVNLLDEAKKKGIEVDLKKLSEILGVPVVGTVANKPKTLKKLMQTIYIAVENKKEIDSPSSYDNISEWDEETVSSIVSKAESVAKEVCTYSDSKYNLKMRKIDKILTSKKFGIPIMIAFLALIFWITITGANYPSSLLSNFFSFIQDKLLILFANMHVPEFLANILIYRNVPNCNMGYCCYASSYGDILPIIYIT